MSEHDPYKDMVIRLLQCVGQVTGPVQPDPILPDEPEWLKLFDPAAGDGAGLAESTGNPYLAIRFPTLAEAIDFYNTETEHGRPLRAFTVEFTTLRQAVEEYVTLGVKRLISQSLTPDPRSRG